MLGAGIMHDMWGLSQIGCPLLASCRSFLRQTANFDMTVSLQRGISTPIIRSLYWRLTDKFARSPPHSAQHEGNSTLKDAAGPLENTIRLFQAFVRCLTGAEQAVSIAGKCTKKYIGALDGARFFALSSLSAMAPDSHQVVLLIRCRSHF